MAEDRNNRTEDPTPKRIADARKKGNIPRSLDLNSGVVLFAAAVLILAQWRRMAELLTARMHDSLGSFPHRDLTLMAVQELTLQTLGDVVMAAGPIVLGLMLAGIFASFLQVGVLITLEPLKPALNKINPLTGFKRIFSLRGVVEMLKGLAKIALVAYLSYQVFFDRYPQIVTAVQSDRLHLGALLADTLWIIAWRSALALLILGVADYSYQRWEWYRNLKMTKQEVKDEAKQQEGSPEVKAEIRKRQRQAARRRMMAEVPKATVVITNPTHFAVALRYDRDAMEVPLVVAKGSDLVAKRIRDLARESRVPVIENPPIARALYKQVEVGDEIPPSLYAAVAEVLVSVTRAQQVARRA